MNTLRIAFSPDDSDYQIAQRAAPAATPGDYLEVNGRFFVVTQDLKVAPSHRKPPQTYRIENSKALPVLSSKEIHKPKAVKSEILSKAETVRPAAFEPEPLAEPEIHSVEAPSEKKTLDFAGIKPGVKIRPKDVRRKHQIISVQSVQNDGVLTGKGLFIRADRLKKYELAG